ncbi:MAG: V-type ATP synthase subunit E family protein [Thermoplasmata archaeon]
MQEDTLSLTAKKIEAEARKKAEKIIGEGKAEARKILEDKNKEIESAKKERIALEKERLEMELTQELHSAVGIARQRILRKKQEIIETLKQEALGALRRMGRERKMEILGKMLKIAKKEIPDGFVYANAEEAEIVKGFAVYPFRGTIKCAGGILVEEKTGERVLDLRYETLLERVITERGEEIWKMLFG